MKKKLFAFFVTGLILSGCAGLSVSDSPENKVLAYASGKAFAITIHKLTAPCTIEQSCADADLTTAWVDLMDRTETMTEIPAAEMIAFYSESVGIIAAPVNDPYGLIGDLTILLTIYSASFENGEMVSIKPVPRDIMTFFGKGYSAGRKVARKE